MTLYQMNEQDQVQMHDCIQKLMRQCFIDCEFVTDFAKRAVAFNLACLLPMACWCPASNAINRRPKN